MRGPQRNATDFFMLSGVHILLSYTCLYQCDHCFLHCSPASGGTFTFAKLKRLLDQAAEMDTVRRVAFEGGEPFLFYPLMVQGIEYARKLGFEIEAVTNGYWALDPEDAKHWLGPLVEAGLSMLDVSDDELHHGDADPSPAKAALKAAREMGLESHAFTLDPPTVRRDAEGKQRGEPIVGGGIRFRGRAADKLVSGLPRRDWREFGKCPDEDLVAPRRVHVDALGLVQLCQGVSIGNIWRRPLKDIMRDYDPEAHPICRPLLHGGPAGLAREQGLDRAEDFPDGFVDACHLCYHARRAIWESFPEELAPPQAYGE
ncbi:MAG: hypothetical protein SVS15_02695 [Thermodesulfobacteriota bacterium]|nr:hypothetical protein [Thermodesulfobacteriota bacterium]